MFTSDFFYQKMNEVQQMINQTAASHGMLLGKLEQLRELAIEAAKAEEAAKTAIDAVKEVVDVVESVV